MRDDRYAALIALVFRPVADPAWVVVVEKVLDDINCAFWVIWRRERHSVQIDSDIADTEAKRCPMECSDGN